MPWSMLGGTALREEMQSKKRFKSLLALIHPAVPVSILFLGVHRGDFASRHLSNSTALYIAFFFLCVFPSFTQEDG